MTNDNAVGTFLFQALETAITTAVSQPMRISVGCALTAVDIDKTVCLQIAPATDGWQVTADGVDKTVSLKEGGEQSWAQEIVDGFLNELVGTAELLTVSIECGIIRLRGDSESETIWPAAPINANSVAA